jgi:hypothetical protein
MSEVVESDVGESQTVADLSEALTRTVGPPKRGAVDLSRKHISVITNDEVRDRRPHFGFSPLRFKDGKSLLNKCDASHGVRLRVLFDHTSTWHFDYRVLNGQGLRAEVDITPRQRAEFARPCSRRRSDVEEPTELWLDLLGGRKKCSDFLNVRCREVTALPLVVVSR